MHLMYTLPFAFLQVQLLGYESVAVFGDCFDEVTLLDPVRFPGEDGYGACEMHMTVFLAS